MTSLMYFVGQLSEIWQRSPWAKLCDHIQFTKHENPMCNGLLLLYIFSLFFSFPFLKFSISIISFVKPISKIFVSTLYIFFNCFIMNVLKWVMREIKKGILEEKQCGKKQGHIMEVILWFYGFMLEMHVFFSFSLLFVSIHLWVSYSNFFLSFFSFGKVMCLVFENSIF